MFDTHNWWEYLIPGYGQVIATGEMFNDIFGKGDMTGLTGLTPSENQMNAYNASEADKNRQFSAEQAQLNRDFQAEQVSLQRGYETELANSAYQRAVQDMQKAGLNPYLAYSQGGAVTPTTAVASGSMASGTSAHNTISGRGSILELMTDLSRTALNLSKAFG